MEQIDISALADLLEQEARWANEFGSGTYKGAFESYLDENHIVWESLSRIILSDEDVGETASLAAEAIAAKAKELVEKEDKRINREKKQLNLNLYMAAYFFPAILSCQVYPDKEGNGTVIAKAICDKWHETFPKHKIQYTDYETIQDGFKKKLCYITTAVCEGLHKGSDCEELQLLKGYRDGYLAALEDGEALIAEYYDIAPTIVKRMEKEEDRNERYRYLWEHYLNPCVSMIREERFGECLDTYERMVNELKERYFDKGFCADK